MALAFVNKIGGTNSPDLIQTNKDMWNYCMSKDIKITAEPLSGTQNQIAGYQSVESGIPATGNCEDQFSFKWKTTRSMAIRPVCGQSQCPETALL